ncbi:MAG: FAD binding domain-containing protein, partial [Candidatus Limnocylindrales bacterium]|nr:FAD binding domain-containing protein [Candidatus Limnocylindrales bacterium]
MPSYAHPFRIVQPTSLAEASELLVSGGPNVALYAGGSELLLAMKQGGLRYDVLIDLKTIPDLDAIDDRGDHVEIGALVTHRRIASSPLIRSAVAKLAQLEGRVANPRVRSTGTLGGNLCFAEPHSDPGTLLMVLDARLETAGPSGPRTIAIEDFTAGAYEAALEPGEILRSIVIPRPSVRQLVGYHRVQQLEHRPMLGVAVRLDLDAAGRTILGCRLSVGAASPIPLRSDAAERILAGDVAGVGERLPAAAAALADAAELIDDLDGSAEYKRHLIGVHLSRMVGGLLRGEDPPLSGIRARRSLDATVAAWEETKRHVPKPGFTVVGHSIPRTDGRVKVTGEAVFAADVDLPRMAHAKVLRSPVAHARILSIDADAARSTPGVIDVLVASDLLGLRRHLFGHAVRDHPILAMDKVVHVGEPVVAVIAEDERTAQYAAELVEVVYDELTPVMTAEAALAPGAPLIHEEPYERGHAPGHVNLDGRVPGTNQLTDDVVAWGDIDAAFARCTTIVEGEYYYPMAFAYALEPYAAIADFRGDEVTVWSNGQHTYTTRRDVADLFGLPLSHVR